MCHLHTERFLIGILALGKCPRIAQRPRTLERTLTRTPFLSDLAHSTDTLTEEGAYGEPNGLAQGMFTGFAPIRSSVVRIVSAGMAG